MTNLPDKAINYEVNGEEVKLSPSIVKSFIVKGNNNLSDQEVAAFLQLCRYQKLNPFLNEAYIIKYGRDAQIVVGKEAFLKRAESHPKFDGFEAGVIVLTDKGDLIERDGSFTLHTDQIVGGWAKIYRKDHAIPLKHTVTFKEYDKGQSSWKKMPGTMIRKVALVQALREQFPETLGGMYTEEESGSFVQGDREFEENKEETNVSKNLIADFKKEEQEQAETDEREKQPDEAGEETEVIQEQTEIPWYEMDAFQPEKEEKSKEQVESIDWGKFTVDQIKKSLDKYSIDYPSKANKAELILIAQEALEGGGKNE